MRAAPYLEAGEYRVVVNAGDQVLIERERYADSYMLVEDAASRRPAVTSSTLCVSCGRDRYALLETREGPVLTTRPNGCTIEST